MILLSCSGEKRLNSRKVFARDVLITWLSLKLLDGRVRLPKCKVDFLITRLNGDFLSRFFQCQTSCYLLGALIGSEPCFFSYQSLTSLQLTSIRIISYAILTKILCNNLGLYDMHASLPDLKHKAPLSCKSSFDWWKGLLLPI